MNDAAPQTPIIFIHIPRCAGTTLFNMLHRRYPPEAKFSTDGFQVDKSVEELAAMPLEQRKKLAIVLGHMHFGLHRYLPNPARYITLLRDPIDRVISLYYFIKGCPPHYLHKEITTRNLSLEDVMRLGMSGELDNEITKVLSGIDGLGFGECTEEIFQKAKQNLSDHFALVGFQERFDETLIVLKNLLCWKTYPFYVAENVNRSRPARENVPEEAVRLIEEHNRFDLALYDYAKGLFEEKLNDPTIFSRRELKKFRLMNRLYRERQRLGAIRHRCRETVGRWRG